MAKMHRALIVSSLVFTSAAGAQYLNDGNFDALSVGTPPDCLVPAGAWGFPPNYAAALACEILPTDVTIVATSSFDPAASGNSMSMNVVAGLTTENRHCPNLLARKVTEVAGSSHARVECRVWVPTAGIPGCSIYIGADHGGGGISNASDRGPQIFFDSANVLGYTNNTGVNTPVITGYPNATWINLGFDIHLKTDTYDLWYSTGTNPLAMVATGLPYRSLVQSSLDRFTFVQFGNFGVSASMYLDDVTFTSCYADCDDSGALDFFDFLCFQNDFTAAGPYSDCDGNASHDFFDFLCFQNEFTAGCP